MIEAYTLSQSYDRLLEEHKALQSQLTEKDATIKIQTELKDEAYMNLTRCHEWIGDYEEKVDSLRKALEEALERLVSNQPHAAGIILSSALGEGDKQ